MFDDYRNRRGVATHIRDQKRERAARVAKMKGRAKTHTASEWAHILGVSPKMVRVYASELGEAVMPDPKEPPRTNRTIDYHAIDREAAALNRRMMQLWRG
jgi:hypothetical protein